MSKFRSYIFVYNNYTKENEDFFKNIKCTYIFFGYEVAPTTGTPHLQGYIVFEHQRHPKAVTKLFGCYARPAGGEPEDQEYCVKYDRSNPHYERGVRPKSKAEIGDDETGRWERIYNAAVEARWDDIDRATFIRHQQSLKRIRREHQPIPVVETITQLRPWQQDLLNLLLLKPDDRTIIYVYDEKGNAGKTVFADYLVVHHEAVNIENGRCADMSYVLPNAPKIVLIDLERSVNTQCNYAFIERVKNGKVSNTKYESRNMRFPNPHVVIFSNSPPEMEKLSYDRWKIITL